MSPPSCTARPSLLGLTVLLACIAGQSVPSLTRADSVQFSTGIDNTLYQFNYELGYPETWLKSNGEGNYFAAGRTLAKNQIQRGLIKFDIPAGAVPAGATVTHAELRLYVVDSPRQDSTPRDFWLVALPPFSQTWGEGKSKANIGGGGGGGTGPGGGDDAELHDATWYHTQYDPDDPNHKSGDPSVANPWFYHPGLPGFWPEGTTTNPAGLPLTLGPGVLGDDPFLLPGWYGPASAAAPVGPKGDFVTWSTPQMALDVQRWLDDPQNDNFGWLVLGDESVVGNLSSKRGFASFQNLDVIDGEFLRPLLTVEYSLAFVPEPSAGTLGLVAALLGGALLARRRRG